MNIPGRKYFKDESVYSDWFPRQGDDMLLRIELIDYTPSSALGVKFEIFSKNNEDTGNGGLVKPATPSIPDVTIEVPAGTPSQADLIKTIYIESGSTAANGLSELVRVRATGTGGSSSDWLEIRVHPPIFMNRSLD